MYESTSKIEELILIDSPHLWPREGNYDRLKLMAFKVLWLTVGKFKANIAPKIVQSVFETI